MQQCPLRVGILCEASGVGPASLGVGSCALHTSLYSHHEGLASRHSSCSGVMSLIFFTDAVAMAIRVLPASGQVYELSESVGVPLKWA